MGAPLNNQNALTTGCRRSLDASRAGHRARRLPRGFKYVAEEASRYANGLYSDVEAAYGEVDREAVECIEAAAAWHQHSLYVLRVLRIDHDQLKPETRVGFSLEIAKAAQRRSDLVKLLKLGQHGQQVDPFHNLTVPAWTGVEADSQSASDAATAAAPYDTPNSGNAISAPVVDRAAALTGAAEKNEATAVTTGNERTT